ALGIAASTTRAIDGAARVFASAAAPAREAPFAARVAAVDGWRRSLATARREKTDQSRYAHRQKDVPHFVFASAANLNNCGTALWARCQAARPASCSKSARKWVVGAVRRLVSQSARRNELAYR